MKYANFFTLATLACCICFAQNAHAQWLQNATTKTITSNTDFNNAPNAVVGIGTANPSNAKLDVQGAIGNTVAMFRKSSSGKGISMVSDWPGVYFNAYFNGTPKSMSSGYGSIVNFDPNIGRMEFGITQNAASAANTNISFPISMSINKDGKVGIGTMDPTSRLEVVGQDAFCARGWEPFITIRDDNSGKSARIQAAHGDICFQKGTAAGNYTYQMVIKESGNIGIGSIDPTSRLEVVGQDGICTRGFEPFVTILDDNSGKSARIQAAHGDISFQKGVPSGQGWNNYVHQMIVKESGDVLIGTLNNPAGYKLSVGGKVICEELKVQLQNAWPDYVFAPEYELKPLEEVEQHIAEKGHLPNIPSACEVEENGISVGEMQTKMMEKIEELTLYLIDLKKENETLKQRVQALENHSK